MDRYTRNYSIALAVVAVLGVVGWLTTLDFRAGELNRLLEKDPPIASYVYAFRVRSVSDGVAEMYTPRSSQAPAVRFLALVSPELGRLPPDHPDMIVAQQELAEVQGRARSIVLEHPDIHSVRWVLDRNWYERRGISP